MKNKVCYIISNLDIGGAELSLFKIVTGLSYDFEFTVISFKKIGKVGEALKNIGINVISLELENNIQVFTKLKILYKIIKTINPDFVHTWMYHADFFGGLVSKIAGVKMIHWNIRNTELIKGVALTTRLIGYLNSILSYFIPSKIIFVSESSKKYHKKLFYCTRKMKVIHNGYDMNKYYYDESKKKQLRRELNIPEKSLVIGSIARYNEYKDHETFINAAVRLLEKNNLIHFVLLGRGVTIENTALLHLVQKSKKQNHFHFLGEKNNINDYYSLFDVFCLHSISEGFPNVLAEAMASKLTCVSTDVGDARLLIRNDKFLIPPNSPFDLSNKLNQICNMTVQERKEIGENNYKIISLQYNSEILLKSYFDLYKK